VGGVTASHGPGRVAGIFGQFRGPLSSRVTVNPDGIFVGLSELRSGHGIPAALAGERGGAEVRWQT
jgi:hypothetical protein